MYWKCTACDLEYHNDQRACLLCGVAAPPRPSTESRATQFRTRAIQSPKRAPISPPRKPSYASRSERQYEPALEDLPRAPSASVSRAPAATSYYSPEPFLSSSPRSDSAVTLEGFKRLAEANRELQNQLRDVKRQLMSSIARDADTDVSLALANDTITGLRSHLSAALSTVTIPHIVFDELHLRNTQYLEDREFLLGTARSALRDYFELLNAKSGELTLVSIATEAAVAKNVTVVKLRDEMACMELKLRQTEALAKEKIVLLAQATEEIDRLKSRIETSELIWKAKEGQWLAQQTSLEKQLSSSKASNSQVAGAK